MSLLHGVALVLLLKVDYIELRVLLVPSDYCLQLPSLYIIVRWETATVPVRWFFILVCHDQLPQAHLLVFSDLQFPHLILDDQKWPQHPVKYFVFRPVEVCHFNIISYMNIRDLVKQKDEIGTVHTELLGFEVDIRSYVRYRIIHMSKPSESEFADRNRH